MAAMLAPAPHSTAAAQQTRLLTADRHNEYGLVYTLPLTALRVEVTATRVERKAGPYYQYAKKYIGTDRVITEDADVWSITDVRVTPYGVPDPDNRYLMQLKPGAVTYMAVGDDGMLLAINREVPAPKQEAQADDAEQPARRYTGREYLQYVDGDFVASQSSAKQAQMLAETLMEVRESRLALTRGTADTMPADGRQLELMLNSLQEQERALTAAFTGTETYSTVCRTYSVMPSDGDSRTVLFRMSDFAGFVAPDDYSGAPVWLDVKITRPGEMPVDDKGEPKRMPKDAVVYAIPGTAAVTVTAAGEELWGGEVSLAQAGTVFGLNPSLFSDRKEPSYAIFDAATGALLRIGPVDE